MKLFLGTSGVLIFGSTLCLSQGFLNLNFENATIVPDTNQGNSNIYASSAIPGWTKPLRGGDWRRLLKIWRFLVGG